MNKEYDYNEAIRELLKDNDNKATKEDIEKLNEWLVSGKEEFYNWLFKELNFLTNIYKNPGVKSGIFFI